MSYCRWSSDNFKSDIYAYEDVNGGWTTHVAGSRYVGDIPEIPPFGTSSPEEVAAAYKAQHEYFRSAICVDIDLPHAGEMFNDPTLEAFKERLLRLRTLGYHVPAYVFEAIDEEIAALSSPLSSLTLEGEGK